MFKTETELRSLNKELPALYAEELETRLETDPLSFVSIGAESIEPYDCIHKNCPLNNCDFSCPELKNISFK